MPRPFNASYGSKEGWEQLFIGAITGIAGSPTFSAQKGNRWAGGVAGGVVNAMVSAQSAADYQLSPERNRKQQKIHKTYSALQSNSVDNNESQVHN